MWRSLTKGFVDEGRNSSEKALIENLEQLKSSFLNMSSRATCIQKRYIHDGCIMVARVFSVKRKEPNKPFTFPINSRRKISIYLLLMWRLAWQRRELQGRWSSRLPPVETRCNTGPRPSPKLPRNQGWTRAREQLSFPPTFGPINNSHNFTCSFKHLY